MRAERHPRIGEYGAVVAMSEVPDDCPEHDRCEMRYLCSREDACLSRSLSDAMDGGDGGDGGEGVSDVGAALIAGSAVGAPVYAAVVTWLPEHTVPAAILYSGFLTGLVLIAYGGRDD